MARYILRRLWFARGVRYRPSPEGVEIPDALVGLLPPDAVKVGKNGPENKDVSGEPFALSQLTPMFNAPHEPVSPLSPGGHKPGGVQGEVRNMNTGTVLNSPEPEKAKAKK